MRTKLIKYEGQKINVKAIVLGKGSHKKNRKITTIVIKDIYDYDFNEYICDHCWLRVGKRMLKDEEEIHRGDVIVT